MRYLHKNGVLHRDFHPDNILRNSKGEWVVTDFGLAKDIDDKYSHQTTTTHAVGRALFTDPVQLFLLKDGDFKTDMYSLAKTIDFVMNQNLSGKSHKYSSVIYRAIAPDMNNRIDDRIMLKDLVDRYATESDKNNQDYYINIFRSDVKLKVYFGDKLGLDISSVDDMIAQYKAFGAAKASFHQNGQQVVDFVDDTHATGICYAIATLVNEEEGKDKLTFHAVRYYDKYEKIDGRWWITEREQHFVYSAVPPLM